MRGVDVTPQPRRREEIAPERQRDLDRVLALLPGSLGRWRGLLQAGLTQLRLSAGNRRRVAIVGPPNAGKSTLYNRLILKKDEKADVGPRPGTTRVAQESDLGIFSLVDTPGADPAFAAGPEAGSSSARQPSDLWERAVEAARQADVLVVLFDGLAFDAAAARAVFDALAGPGRPWVVALNKMDAVGGRRAAIHAEAARALGLQTEDVLPISARTGAGLERLLVEVVRREPEIVAALGQALPAYRGTLARAAITRAASTAAAIAVTPLPMIAFIPLTGVQTALVLSLARVYGYRITFARARELIVTFGIGLLARSLFYELVKLGGPPGWLVAASVAAGATTALGYGAAAWFDRGERLSRERMERLSRSVGGTMLERLRGRKRPRRDQFEQDVRVVLEETLGRQAPDEPTH